MGCLPEDHVPLRESEGEKRRNRLYIEQLPPHDLDPELCHPMSDVEKKRLTKIADKFKAHACGVGAINSATSQKVNITNIFTCIDIHYRNVPNVMKVLILEVRTLQQHARHQKHGILYASLVPHARKH